MFLQNLDVSVSMSRGLVKYTLYIPIFPFYHIYTETVCVTNNVRGKNSKDTISCLHDMVQIVQDRTSRKHVRHALFQSFKSILFNIKLCLSEIILCYTSNECLFFNATSSSICFLCNKAFLPLLKQINLHTINIKYKVRHSTCHMLCPGMSIIFSPSSWDMEYLKHK